jgi:hypothetical protein
MTDVSAAWEAQATATFEPPEVRAQKNKRFVARLAKKYSERAIRQMLLALSARDEPMCCKNLRQHDLAADPLHHIVRPFELLGLDFRVRQLSESRFRVDIGEAYDTVGSGGEFVIEQCGDRGFRVVAVLSEWIA